MMLDRVYNKLENTDPHRMRSTRSQEMMAGHLHVAEHCRNLLSELGDERFVLNHPVLNCLQTKMALQQLNQNSYVPDV